MDTIEIVNSLNTKCNAVMNSKFLLSSKRIRDLLKLIVTTQLLYSVVEKALDGFDYKAEFVGAVAEGKNRKYIIFPQDDRKLVAFAFCLLSEFECGDRALDDFLAEYYQFSQDTNKSYLGFVSELIPPFFKAFSRLVDEAAVFFNDERDDSNAVDVFGDVDRKPDIFGGEPVRLDPKKLQSLLDLMPDVFEAITNEVTFSVEKKKDVVFIANAFMQSFLVGDQGIIRSLYLSLKQLLSGCKYYSATFVEFDRILKKLGVL